MNTNAIPQTGHDSSSQLSRRRRKAIALLSGGLDSLLAAKMVKDQGVEVVGLHLLSPFGCREDVQQVADTLGIPLIIKEKGAAYLDLVENPRYGYGKNMNPCIDCRVFMFQLADVVRQENGADFVVTGEVLGQRPMSQHRHAFEMIDAKSPLNGLLVRPLSAIRLEETIPEKEGWVNREAFLQITGRGRKEQLELAAKLNLKEFSSPGGGCLLTDANFSQRLRDFFDQPTYQNETEKSAQSELLPLGRYFRLTPETRVSLGRNHQENMTFREKFGPTGGTFVELKQGKGPKAVIYGKVDEAALEWVAGAIALFSGTTPPAPEREFIGVSASKGETAFRSQNLLSESDVNSKRVGVNP